MEIKVLPIGTVLKYNGVRLQVIARIDRCRGCYFIRRSSCPYQDVGSCAMPWRSQDVIFRKIDINKKENLHGRVTIGQSRKS